MAKTATRALTILMLTALAFGPSLAQARGSFYWAQQVTPPAPNSEKGKARPPHDDTSSTPDRSEQLSRSHGVIEPPAVGDKNIVPSPSVGPNAMPVIPPPGSPDKNPDIQPK